MIKKVSRLNIPHGNKTIWRYIGLDKFLDMIVSQELFFTNADKMSDKYEGLIPLRNQNNRVQELIKSGLQEHEAHGKVYTDHIQLSQLKKLTLLNCWNVNPHESYALWKIYLGGAKSGVAIKSTVSKLVKAIKNGNDKYDEDIFISNINYTDFILEDSNDRFKVITTKNKFYDYEKEMRLFILHYPSSEGGTQPPYDITVGRRLKVDINELISEIYLSPFSGRWFDNSFVDTIRRITPSLASRIRISNILDN